MVNFVGDANELSDLSRCVRFDLFVNDLHMSVERHFGQKLRGDEQ